MREIPCAITLVSCLLAPPGLAREETWSQFRGPRGRGVALGGDDYPATLDPQRNLRWRTPLPPGHSSPCVVDDRVFLTGHAEDHLEVLAVSRADGSILWRRSEPVTALERTHPVNGPASSTPCSDGSRVFAWFGSVGLLCFDRDGNELWRRPQALRRNTFGSAASPILAEGRLVLCTDTQEESVLEVLDPGSGAVIWSQPREGFASGWSTPVAWSRGDVTELLVYGVWWLKAYDLGSGAERWAIPGLTDEPIITPVTGDGLVFLTSYNMKTNPEVLGLPDFATLLAAHDHDRSGTLDAAEADENRSVLSRFDADGEGDHPLRIFFRFLDEDRDGEITADEWRKLVAWLDAFEHANAAMALKPGGPGQEAGVAWQHGNGVPECPSPLYLDGCLYLVKNGGILTCLDARTGALHYQVRLGLRGPIYASPVAGGGRIFVATARGEVAVFDAGPTAPTPLITDLGARIMATPALEDGTVYVRTEEALLAFRDG